MGMLRPLSYMPDYHICPTICRLQGHFNAFITKIVLRTLSLLNRSKGQICLNHECKSDIYTHNQTQARRNQNRKKVEKTLLQTGNACINQKAFMIFVKY